MLISANIIKINQLSAHHGPEKRTDSMDIWVDLCAFYDYNQRLCSCLYACFPLLSKRDKQLSKSDK